MLCLLDQGRIVTLVAMDGNKTPFVVLIVRHVKMKKKRMHVIKSVSAERNADQRCVLAVESGNISNPLS